MTVRELHSLAMRAADEMDAAQRNGRTDDAIGFGIVAIQNECAALVAAHDASVSDTTLTILAKSLSALAQNVRDYTAARHDAQATPEAARDG